VKLLLLLAKLPRDKLLIANAFFKSTLLSLSLSHDKNFDESFAGAIFGSFERINPPNVVSIRINF
jgi:hypothetical protein